VNPRLGRLLSDLTGSDEWARFDSWSRVIVVNSIGRIPPVSTSGGDFMWNRGFNVVLLGPKGVPRYFCKCRPAEDAILRRATVIREALLGDPCLRTVVPRTRGGSDDVVQVQLSDFIVGELFSRAVERLSLAGWEATLREVLATADLVSSRAATLLPEMAANGPIDLSAACQPHLEYIEKVGVPRLQLEFLSRGLAAAGATPRTLQHGDLWSGNVLRAAGSWWLLDFEMFGQVQVPLYDVFHLVRSSVEERAPEASGDGATWSDRMARGDATARAGRRVISWASARHGLNAQQIVGTLLYYAVDLAARIHHRGTPRSIWGPYFAEVDRLSRALQAGESLEKSFLEP
jgi:hypothetical protein